MAITKKTRFEVFKRDKFTCQYCGTSSPDVILEIDHIKPKSKGGNDDILNLTTACFDCNRGKSNRKLNQSDEMKKKKDQLNELEKKKQQLEMMYQWQNELLDIENYSVDKFEEIWNKLTVHYSLTDEGRRTLKKLLKKYDFSEIIECARISIDQYFHLAKDDSEEELEIMKKSVEKSFDFVEKILRNKKNFEEKPYLSDLFYIRGIMRNRYNYLNEWKSIEILEKLYNDGVSVGILKDIALDTNSLSGFEYRISEFLEEKNG